MLSAIVPTLDERESVERYLPAALTLADEVIVSDGGSRDGTVERALALGGRVVTGPPGRGSQLHRGAREARGRILLFLHADTTLPADAARAIREAVADGAVGGGFLVRFAEEGERPILRLGSWLVRLRTRWLQVPLGDQAQFATRDAYRAVGGYAPWPILEDIHFIRRLRRHGRLAVLTGPVVTSGRRFAQRGVLRTVATNWAIWTLYLLGVSPHRLARFYRHVR